MLFHRLHGSHSKNLILDRNSQSCFTAEKYVISLLMFVTGEREKEEKILVKLLLYKIDAFLLNCKKKQTEKLVLRKKGRTKKNI